jgi:hypothetical protein
MCTKKLREWEENEGKSEENQGENTRKLKRNGRATKRKKKKSFMMENGEKRKENRE